MFVERFSDGERSSVGRAPVCGTGCRRFEPDRSPQFKLCLFAELFLCLSLPSRIIGNCWLNVGLSYGAYIF